MGFGAMFIGFMFLYDFQMGLRAPGSEEAYALLDIFPDVLGWLLLFWGIYRLSQRKEMFLSLKAIALFMTVFSVFTLVKDTFLFDWFFSPKGEQNATGLLLDGCEHFFTLVFVWLLFQKTQVLCRKCGEDKLSRFHAIVPRIAVTEGALFLLSALLRLLPLQGTAVAVAQIISRLDFLFWVFLVWFGTIALFRAMVRIDDL